MNLATKDIRHNLGRFALTAVGIGLLLMIVLGMSGIYRGMIDDALVVVDRVGADLWVVHVARAVLCGDFARSRQPGTSSSGGAGRGERGVSSPTTSSASTTAGPCGSMCRLAWPDDQGGWLPLAAGRPLGQAHYEMIADQSLGLALGGQLKLGKDTYTVVGIAKDGFVGRRRDRFFTVHDAQSVQFDLPARRFAWSEPPGCAAGRARCRSRATAAAGAGRRSGLGHSRPRSGDGERHYG